MAQLDPLLKSLIDRGGQELLLIEGQQPTIRLSLNEVRPVSQQNLTRAQIGNLLAELADQINAHVVLEGGSARFIYDSPHGTPFLCESWGDAGSYRARVAPQTLHEAARALRKAQPPVGAAAAPVKAAPQAARVAVPVAPAEPAAPAPAREALVLPTSNGPEIERYLRLMVERKASDLHVSSCEVPMLRLDGDIIRIPGAAVHSAEQIQALLQPIIPERNRSEFEETNDTDFAHEIEGVARFRANIFRDRKGWGGVFRMIPSEILTAEQLGLPPSVLALCGLLKGLVLVTGPTGSGKSTTLAAMVDHINKTRTDHIITIEDPVEFVHRNQNCLVNQREVITHTRGFKPALRAALREDPDIVLVGEMRDLETIAIAIETAETGHLVFGTLHTTTTVSTVDRIIDQFPSDRQAQIRTMLSESIKGVVSQTLLKRIGGGRAAALEVLIVNSAISNLIREGKTFQIPSLMQTGRKLGMVLLNDALLALVKSKTVEPEEAYRKSVDKSGFASMLKNAHIQLKTGPAD